MRPTGSRTPPSFGSAGRSRVALAIALGILAVPSATRAQDVDALLAQGRFDEVVQASSGLAAAESDALAGRMIDQAYARYEAEDYEYAIRGFGAAARLPNLGRERVQEAQHLLAWSLYLAAERQQRPGTVASAQASLPRLVEAQRLVNGLDKSRFDVFPLADALENLVFLQRAIIREGG